MHRTLLLTVGWIVAFTLFAATSPLVAQDGGKIDLNQADIQKLDTLPGIGPAIAKRIVRKENTSVSAMASLTNIKETPQHRTPRRISHVASALLLTIE